jgi:hypothetical protein
LQVEESWEIINAASAQFDKLNKDSDDTLDSKEVKGVLGKKEFKAADPDNDGTLTKDEYLAIVERLFKKADVNNDGTLDAKELKSKAQARWRDAEGHVFEGLALGIGMVHAVEVGLPGTASQRCPAEQEAS